jgi:lipopolysaccharide/colanic/teichoic acid biosynthesis glycosyltransferase
MAPVRNRAPRVDRARAPAQPRAARRRAALCGIPRAKRRFDLALACLLALPVGLVCAVLVAALLLAQGRPVFYRSERMRTAEEGFVLWKFRTMTGPDRPPSVTAGHVAARITPMGRVLRSTRLDELPQLWNVLRGDMTFVGPRPPLRAVVTRHPDVYAGVLAARPGITGLATVLYHRTEARLLAGCVTQDEADRLYDKTCVRQKARLDLLYRSRWSPGLDLAILGATLTGRWPRRRG